MSAVLADLVVGISVVGVEYRWHVAFEDLDLHRPFEQHAVAFLAVPSMGIRQPVLADPLHYQPDGIRSAPWRMWHVGPQEVDRTFREQDVVGLAVVLNPDRHVAFDLEEKFLRRIHVVVCPCIRSTDDGDHEIIFAEDGFRAQRGLEFIGVLRNPFHEIEGRRAADVVGSWLWLRRHVPLPHAAWVASAPRSNQEITTGGMGFTGQFALQKLLLTNVRFGSVITGIPLPQPIVRFLQLRT